MNKQTNPERIQLTRLGGKGGEFASIKVDRSSRYANPFVTGQDGNQVQCVDKYRALLTGPIPDEGYSADLSTARSYVLDHIHVLRGKSLSCWCELGHPCHADVLLELANGSLASKAEEI